MRIRRPTKWALAVALLLTAGTLSACTAPVPRPQIAIALSSDAGRWSDVADVLRDRFVAVGYSVDIRSAGDDIPTQLQQVSELLDADPLALIVAPVDAESLTPVLDDADPDVEVVSLGALIRDTGAIDRVVEFDAAAEGSLQAVALLQGLGLVDDAGDRVADAPRGPFSIELFAGSPDEARTEPAYAAAMSVLKPYLNRGVLDVVSRETSLDQVATLRGNADTAASRLTRILRDSYAGAFPDAVLTPSDEIARGVAGALLAAGAVIGEGFPVLTGRGGELRSIAALVDGRQYATLLEDPRQLAAEAADRVIDALAPGTGVASPSATAHPAGPTVDNGARPVPASLLQPTSVRVGDIPTLVIDSGYWSRDRVDHAIAQYGLQPAE